MIKGKMIYSYTNKLQWECTNLPIGNKLENPFLQYKQYENDNTVPTIDIIKGSEDLFKRIITRHQISNYFRGPRNAHDDEKSQK